MDGKAIVPTFFSSANVRQIFITFSKSSRDFFELFASQVGEKAWIICLHFKLGASPIKAEKIRY